MRSPLDIMEVHYPRPRKKRAYLKGKKRGPSVSKVNHYKPLFESLPAGLTHIEIAKRLDLDYPRAKYWAKILQYQAAASQTSLHKMILKLREMPPHMEISQIAAMFGIKYKYAYHVVRCAKYPFKRKERRSIMDHTIQEIVVKLNALDQKRRESDGYSHVSTHMMLFPDGSGQIVFEWRPDKKDNASFREDLMNAVGVHDQETSIPFKDIDELWNILESNNG